MLVARARKSAVPKVTDRKGFAKRFGAIPERLSKGHISRRQAAKELGIGYANLKRLLDSLNQEPPEG
jgi:putative DNA-invertase from lambdoid prophage Rac